MVLKISALALMLAATCAMSIASSIYTNPTTGYVGALYSISNLPANTVLVTGVLPDGTIQYVGEVTTQGNGTNSTSGDSLFSQGSVAVAKNSGMLFVVNANSNSLSVFSINSMDATKITLVSQQSLTGEFPVSVAVWEGSSSNVACVISSGSKNYLECYTFSSMGFTAMDSSWTKSSGQNLTTPPAGLPHTPSTVGFTADGNAVVVLIKGNPTGTVSTGTMNVYPINWSAKTLGSSQVNDLPFVVPFGITTIGTNGIFVIAADPAAGSFTIETGTGVSTTKSTFTTLDSNVAKALCWSAYAPTVNVHYGVSAATPALTEFTIDAQSLNVSATTYNLTTYGSIGNMLDAAVLTVSNGDWLYGVDAKSRNITAYWMKATNGGFQRFTPASVNQMNTAIPVSMQGMAGYIQMTTATAAPTKAALNHPLMLSQFFLFALILALAKAFIV